MPARRALERGSRLCVEQPPLSAGTLNLSSLWLFDHAVSMVEIDLTQHMTNPVTAPAREQEGRSHPPPHEGP